MKKKKDILIVARPDHSMQIYNALLGQSKLNYLYLTYKVFPKWVKKITGIKKLTVCSRNYICSWKLTFVNLCRYKYKFSFAQSWDETHVFDSSLKRLFRTNDVKLIHYWPEYGDSEIIKYIKQHPESHAFADIHMPHPRAVYNSMKPIYERYGITPESTQLYKMVQEQSDFAQKATDILVPSSYVADSYRDVYNDKNYHIVSYGITVSRLYTKRNPSIIKEFVYAGRISLEKGSDLLLDFFEKHQDLNIHLYGSVIAGQESIFNKYNNVKNIYFHGSVPKMELQERLNLYDVGIHLSRFDAYSLAVGEMIGCGLPVIVSENTGNKDDIRKEELGLVTSLDLDSIEKAIKIIVDPNNYNKIVMNIDNYILNKNKTYGERMIDFYLNILHL